MTGASFVLQDEEGQLLTVKEEVEGPPETIAPESQNEEEERESLQTELKAARVETIELWQQLGYEKTQFRELWRSNCWCLPEHDQMLMQKDSEIEQLKQLLS